ncbi:MAG: C4-dicarboxylate ABC transporter, partial [Rhodospirillaceae bacterium]
FVSWWAYTFPLDALALAVMTLGHLTGSSGLLLLGGVLLGVATLVVSLVALRTVQALIKGSLFQPE